jgi:hypothetical protein
MKKVLKTEEKSLLDNTQQTYQLMNMADSLDEIKKCLQKLIDEIEKQDTNIIIENEEDKEYTLKEFISDNFFYFIMIILIIVLLVRP